MFVYLAAEFILHGKVNKADTSSDKGVDEPNRVQPCLELGRNHAHEDLSTEGLDTVLTLHTLTDPLWRSEKNRHGKERVKDLFVFFNKCDLRGIILNLLKIFPLIGQF